MTSEREDASEDATTDRLLVEGEVEIEGQIIGSSNATLLVTCRLGESSVQAIYKPERGERRLWDFPAGLWRREVASYELSEALGIGIVPLTIVRREAPFGVGSMQLLVGDDGQSHYFTLRRKTKWDADLETIAAFDVVANNADRKSGHVLLDGSRLWAIDHGLTFHREEKLRTVIWEYADAPLRPAIRQGLERLHCDGIPDRFAELLDDGEIEGLTERISALLEAGVLPAPDEDREWPPYPWPLV